MSSSPLVASSSTSGFFQALPILPPQYTKSNKENPHAGDNSVNSSDDQVISKILNLYLPSDAHVVTDHAHHIARLSLDPAILKYATEAETNHPVLRPLTTFGEENKNDPLWTTLGWQKLKDIGYEQGLVAVAYENSHTTFNRRIHQFVSGHFWGPTGTMTGCPQSMTDGATTLLSIHLNDPDGDQPGRKAVFEEAYHRLTSRDPHIAWTSGQWMTERTGGSDVSGTETVARKLTAQEMQAEVEAARDVDADGMPLGPWKIDGFKWFSSATDSEMSILLARTSKGGLSAFYIPMRRRVGKATPSVGVINEHSPPLSELNGVRIQRLKNKLGTKSLPTAELELKGARGWLIGTEGRGVKEISAILNITRLSTAAGSVGNWGRGLAVCRAYSKVRKVRGGLLQDNPAHLTWMADETVKYWAAAHFAFLGVAMQGVLEQDWKLMVANTRAKRLIPEDKKIVKDLLRLLLPVMKAQVSVASVSGLRNCMECLGGVGYCENNEDGGLMNIAKAFRDNLVNPIWEGTVSVMAEDVVRVLTDKRLGGGNILKVFMDWVENVLEACRGTFASEVRILKERLSALQTLIGDGSKEELLYRGREILDHIEVAVSGAVMMYETATYADDVTAAIARRFILSRTSTIRAERVPLSRGLVDMDRAIFLGRSSEAPAPLSRL